MRDLKTLWAIVLKEFNRIAKYDNCIFMCHVIENTEGNKAFRLSKNEQEFIKEDLYSRPESEYGTVVYGKIEQVRRQRLCLWEAGDNKARIKFIKNRIKDLS